MVSCSGATGSATEAISNVSKIPHAGVGFVNFFCSFRRYYMPNFAPWHCPALHVAF